ncbi:hypothetical protein ASG58_22680 [Rhizobium sp. Leaf383]|nr:hypothetical protein ASF14_20505 [Sphingomonas sp. Leaf257]KQS79933.1 hypothetical protein ASG58_22680 [Rhizobium sp. Leaf383]
MKVGDKLFILFLLHFLQFFLKLIKLMMGVIIKILYYLYEEKLYQGPLILKVQVNFQIHQL